MNKRDYKLYKRVMEFSAIAHEGQYRKFSNIPYVTHPIDVSILIRKYGGDINQICAGLLHDVVEDTKYTLEDIEIRFGLDIAQLVYGLTHTYDDDTATSEEKHDSEMKRYGTINDERVLLIKLCDIYSNLFTIENTSVKFATRFREGKMALVGLIDAKSVITNAEIIADLRLLSFEKESYGRKSSNGKA